MDFINWTLNLGLFNHWLYWVVFAFAFLECLAFIGVFVPGQTVVVIAGILAIDNKFSLFGIIISATIGAFFGDLASFIVGKRLDSSFFIKWGKYFFLDKKTYLDAKGLLKEHPGKSLIIGRFHSFTRAIVPFSAGVCRVNAPKAIFYIFIGAFLWAFTFTMIGYLFSHSYRVATTSITGLMTIVLLFFIIFFFWVYRKRKSANK